MGSSRKSFIIGEFTFHPHLRELIKGSTTTRLEERTAQALHILCRRSDEIVSRDDLISEIWQGRAVSENSVAIVISDLRKILGDDARAPKIIQTIPKRGYRALDVAPAENDYIPHNAEHAAVQPEHRNMGLDFMALAACITCSAAAIIYFLI